jgi:cystathionine gamma-lyase
MTQWPPPGDGGVQHPRADGAPGTRVVHAGLPAPAQGTPFLPGPTLAAPFHLIGPSDASPFGYGRDANPTWSGYEAALGELEGGEAVLFGSGLAAVAAVLLPMLEPGDVVVVPGDGYPAIRELALEQLRPRGVEVRVIATDADAITAALPGATLVWIETPSNPGLAVLDVAALAAAAHAEGALLAVDNTLATPLLQRPLQLGADLSIASASKGLTGHSDLVLGYVAAADPAVAARTRAWRNLTGAIAGPFEAWLAHRSLATLDVRHDRQCANALAIARALSARDDVHDVRYPGLPDDPGHALAARSFGGVRFGGVVCFDLVREARAQAFLAACGLIAEATSFGGVHSSAERRLRWAMDDVSPGFIRMSAGIEDADDLVADVCGALDASRVAGGEAVGPDP